MVTIEADNYDEAIKQARKAKRAAKKQAKIDLVNSDMAYNNAYASLGRLTARLMDNVRSKIWEHDPRMTCDVADTYKLCVEHAGGFGEIEFYKYVPERMFLDGAGFALGVQIRDADNHKIEYYALGAYNDKVAMIEIPRPIVDLLIAHLDAKAEKKSA